MNVGRTIIAGAVSCVMLAGCSTAGSGDLITEQRSVASFEAVDVSGGIDLQLIVDPGASPAVAVTFDDNLIDRVRTEVEDGVLIIEATGSWRISGGGRFVSVVVSNLEELAASGGSDVVGTGELKALTLEASGGSDVDLGNLATERMIIDISGGSDVVVRPLVSVVGEASGGSDATIVGDPGEVDVETSGGADLRRS